MKFEWDLSEFNRFATNIRDGFGIDSALRFATQQIARVLHQHLLTNTPIDTGNLRKMWSAGNNLMFTVKRVGNTYRVTLINLARNGSKKGFMYGTAVNDGHRTSSGGWVIGRFFVEASIKRTEAELRIIVMRELQQWWRSV